MKKYLRSLDFRADVLSCKSLGEVWVDCGTYGCRAYENGSPVTVNGLKDSILRHAVKVKDVSPFSESCTLIYVDNWRKGSRFTKVVDSEQAIILQK